LGYHRAFYKHVEALTVTPFSARARDRALHSVLFGICRHTIPDLKAQMDAGNILDQNVRSQVEVVIDKICLRIEKIDRSEVHHAREELDEILDIWTETAQEYSPEDLYWTSWGLKSDKKNRRLMKSDDRELGVWITPLSMRDVDAQSPVKLLKKSDLGGFREQ